MIGGNNIWGEYFAGQIDDVRVYNVALTAAEVTTDMNTPVQASAPDTASPTAPTNLTASPIGPTQVNLSWTAATDNVGVTGYRIFRGGLQIGTSTSTSFGDGAAAANTAYSYTVRAVDAAGNVSPDSNVANATTPAPDTTAPVISAIAPGNITQTNATIAWTTNELSDTQVEYGTTTAYGSSTTLNSSLVTSHSASLSGLTANTTYHYRVKSKDAAANLATSGDNSFTTQAPAPDTSPPTVSITSPANGAALSGTISITANAADNIGVAGVQFKLDGNNLSAEDASSPYSLSWNTTTATNGSHQLTATARDAAGNIATSTALNVTVSNGGGTGTPLNINGAQHFQTMDGWGTSANSASWDNGELAPALDSLLAGGSRIWRVIVENMDWETINDDGDPNTFNWTYYDQIYSSPKFEELWSTISYLNSKGVTNDLILNFMGKGPDWMMSNPGSHHLNTANVSYENEWVEMVVSAAYYAKNNRGLQFGLFAPNNEPDWDVIEGVKMDQTIYARAMDKVAKRLNTLENMGNIRLLGPDTANSCAGVAEYREAMLGYPDLLNKLDHFTIHSYNGSDCDAQARINSAPGTAGKNFWMSEFGTFKDGMTNLGQGAAALLPWDGFDSVYQHSILNGNPAVAPNDAGNSPALLSYNSSTHTYTPRKEYYQFAQLFKYIPKGSFRIGATESNANVTTYAFHDPVTNRVTIVGQNLGSTNVTFSGTLSNLPGLTSFEYYTTDNNVNLQRGSDVPVVGGAFSVVAPANGIFTLTTAAPTDAMPPSSPGGLAGVGAIGAANLTWSAASDNVGVTSYNVHRSTTANFTLAAANKIGQTANLNYTDLSVPAGTYYYRVTAQDAAGNVGPSSNEISAAITTDTQAPIVSLTAPANGATVSGTVSLGANASDDVAVAGVTFLVNGVVVGTEDTSAPYSFDWNSASVANGTYGITARARDGAGNTTTSVAVSITVNNVAASGLIAAYGFNEGSGAAANDSTSVNNTGTLNGATWTTLGRYGSALSFNGSSNTVTIADANELDLTNGMTLEAWVRPNSLSNWSTVLLKEAGSTMAYGLYAANGGNQPPSGYVQIGGDQAAAGNSILALNIWSHLALTYSGSVLNIYVNGTLAGTRSVSGSMLTSTGALKIGGNSIWGEYFSGLIDEVRVYNRALSTTEVQTDMNTPL
jgi:hypothetical protein